jgi:protein-S-isoprenylcysteine O-methyltransferase Ste14
LPHGILRALGWPSIFVGLAIGLLGFREMKRARTNVDPYKPTTAIVAEGSYRYTRNPLYVGMTLMYAGVSARANALPAALFLPAVLAVMQSGVIEREERYLERKFGDEYSGYKTRVRRWI